MPILEAHVIDKNHLELSYPIQIPVGSKVKITIESAEEAIDEREFWSRISKQGLETAYSENEPEYSSKLIITPNPEYQP